MQSSWHQQIIVMNILNKSFSFVIAAGLAGVAIADLGGVFSSLPFRGEATLIAGVSAGLLALLIRDYARRPAGLRPRATIVRPAVLRPAPVRREVRRLEAIVERAA